MTLDLDKPILETNYVIVNSNGTIIATFGNDRETAQAEATKRGLRLVKTVKEVEE